MYLKVMLNGAVANVRWRVSTQAGQKRARALRRRTAGARVQGELERLCAHNALADVQRVVSANEARVVHELLDALACAAQRARTPRCVSGGGKREQRAAALAAAAAAYRAPQ